MATRNDDGFKSFTATAAAIGRGVRVTVNSSGVILASGAANDTIGVAVEDIAASGTGVVKLLSAPGTHICKAGAAIARGATLHAIASGLVDDAGANAIGLIALEAATASGDLIECVHYR